MSKVWTPDGNRKQTEIDVQIAALDSSKAKVSLDLARTRRNLILIEEDLYELEDHINNLKGEVPIVSMSEYSLIRSKYYRMIEAKDNHLKILTEMKSIILRIEKQKEELAALREKSATKIINKVDLFNEIRKKRSQDRD